MTGVYTKVSILKQERIKQLTEEGYKTAIIAERLNLKTTQVYYYQRKLGLRGEKK